MGFFQSKQKDEVVVDDGGFELDNVNEPNVTFHPINYRRYENFTKQKRKRPVLEKIKNKRQKNDLKKYKTRK